MIPLSLRLASRNLFHDRLRFVAALVGIVFSVVLVMVQMGLYLGFQRIITTTIDHAPADLWVVSHGAKSFESPSLLDLDARQKALTVRDVTHATPVVVGFSVWRMDSGELTPIIVIGSDLGARGLVPWNLAEGSVQDLKAKDAVAVDRTYFSRLGVSGLGSTAEIRGQKVRVAAVTDGVRSFTSTPFVFADIERARTFLNFPSKKINHLLIRTIRAADTERVRQDLQEKIADADVLTPEEFRDRSRSFWLFRTGAGAALFAGALLGLIVGTVIVGQTLYSSTKDHLPEFATLRAIGCSNRYIYKVICYQAVLSAVIGFCIAYIVGIAVVGVTAKGALPIVITPELVSAIFVLTIIMCTASAIIAIARVVRIDPVMVLAQ